MTVGVLAARATEDLALDRPLFGDEEVERVCRAGAAVVRGALRLHQRWELLREASAVRSSFLTLPRRVNGVRQHAEQLTVRIGDPAHPCLNGVVADCLRAAAACAPGTGAHRFAPAEARYMRYQGRAAGLGAHRDGKCYTTLVCVFSIAGTAPFTVFPEPGVDAYEDLVLPGDLVLLRAPGLAGHADGRPRHSVGAPLEGERVSLTLRMSGGCA